MCYRAGALEIDPARRLIRRAGQELYLRSQSFEVLAFLIEHRDRVVSKEELHHTIWKGVAVGDDAIVQCIADIRRALGDDSKAPVCIRTIPKLGYRFIAPVESLEPMAMTSLPDTPALAPRRSRRGQLTAAAVVLLSVAAAAGWRAWPWRSEAIASAAAGPNRVVVLDFENRTQNHDLSWLQHGLADMVITDLSRFDGISVLSREERDAGRTGEQLRVSGSFTALGDSVRLELRLHDARTGRLIGAEHATAETPGEIFANVDLLSLKLARRMGLVTEPRTGSGLAQVVTTNLEAYRHYALGLARSEELRTKEAVESFERAIALDPGFAMAYARIGYVYAIRHNMLDRAKPYLRRAFENPSRLTERDRLHIAAWYAIANQDYENAIAQCRAILERYPDDAEIAGRLATLLHGESRLEEARDVALLAYAANTTNPGIVNILGGTYSLLGRHSDAITVLHRYVALDPGEANAYDSLGLAYQWAGRYDEAIAAYEKAIALDAEFEVAIIHLGNTYFQQGRFRDAIRQFERYIAASKYDNERARGYSSISRVHLEQGAIGAAESAARKAAWPATRFLTAIARGDRAAAKEYLKAYTRGAGRGSGLTNRYRHYAEGRLALLDGRHNDALASFRAALSGTPPTYELETYEDCLAQAYLHLGQYDEAIAEFTRVLGINPNLAPARLGLARALDRRGDTVRARAEYEAFLRIWKHADADAPDLIAAKRRLATLGAKRIQARAGS